ncbi:type II toxin-antitoxin system ParD family antitoxin [Mesorhizobium australicum]|uniref:Antitoxin ParD1/3/4 n=1 Tax=Mesorhizobium australicum TaxID=536018 RepID=A0A1X7P115_9HYPH|nr:type II toxin-antitoxin system ParD family antitoxin [Mesorhizobium australicum]SMH44280.1 antitoxin ParD1/3/4 [Mesorhizobium australicum]
MGRIEKISIALPEEMLQSVKEAVDSGQYASTSEVIRDALRGWQLREPLRKAEIERLRKAWEEGLASGAAREYDLEEILSGARRRLEEMQRKSA